MGAIRDMIRLGYTQGVGEFRVSAQNKEEIADILAAIRDVGEYNAFVGENVAEQIETIMLSPNPICRILFGLEGSPVIYFEVEDKAFCPVLERHMHALLADEVWTFSGGPWGLTVRAWWD